MRHFFAILITFMALFSFKIICGKKYIDTSNNDDENDEGSKKTHVTEKAKLESCSEDKLMNFLAELQAINPESIIRMSTLENMDALCRKVTDSLDSIDSYLLTCEPPHEKDLYVQLIKGIDGLHTKLCTDAKFKNRFMEHESCLHDLCDEFEDCLGPPDWIELNDDGQICRVYKYIADCYYTKAAIVCGIKAAKVMKELAIAVINSILPIQCTNVACSNPAVPDAMPESHSSAVRVRFY